MSFPYTNQPRSYPPGVLSPSRRALPRRRSSSWLLFAGFAGLFSLVLLPIFLFGGAAVYYSLSGRIYPGITSGAFSAGSLTREELVDKIDTKWNFQPVLVLTDGAQSLPVTPVELGLWIDPHATAQQAYAVGRGANALGELLWLARFQSTAVEPVLVFNQDAARAGLERIASQINAPMQNAALRFENGQWTTIPGKTGSAVDISATIAQVRANPNMVLESGFYPLVMYSVAPQVADLTPELEQLRAALDQPLKLRAYDPVTNETIEWSVPRDMFAAWVNVENGANGITLHLDPQHLIDYLNDWQSSLGEERSLAPFTPPADLTGLWQAGEPFALTLQHNPTHYEVQIGDTLTRIAFMVGMPYWKIQQANPGIDPNSLRTGEVLTIPSKNEMLPLPVVPGKRIVISISAQHLWTYENGQERSDHVISTGIDRSPTIPGIYQVQTHEVNAYASAWDLYMPHFMGIYEGWPGFMNGIHGLPTLSGGRQLWAGSLGRPVSYGCIILDLPAAKDLYNWAEEGVIVEIRP